MFMDAHPLMKIGGAVMVVATVTAMVLFLGVIVSGPQSSWMDRPMLLALWLDMVGFFFFVVGYCIDIAN